MSPNDAGGPAPGRAPRHSFTAAPPPSNGLAGTLRHGCGDRRPTGCPCGCMTKLPYFDDPDCVRHQPAPEPGAQVPPYDIQTLGLAPHDRSRCTLCRAAGQDRAS